LRSATPTPEAVAAATTAGLSSKAATLAPPSARAMAVARPLAPSPNTATFLPAKLVTGIKAGSPQFEARQTDQRQQHRNHPEADDHLRLGPAEGLEMVMNRGHPKNALSRQFR